MTKTAAWLGSILGSFRACFAKWSARFVLRSNMVGSYCADAWSVFLFTHSHRNAWNYDTCEMAARTVCCSSTKGSTKVKRNCLMKALHSCEFLEDFLLLFKVLLNLPLTGCNQLNGGLRYTKMFMSGTDVCLLYHACQLVPPILPDAQCGQRGGIEGSLAIETERTKKTAMNIMDVRKERANKQTTQGSQGG